MRPTPLFECPQDRLAEVVSKIPQLLRACMSVGVKICGPPAPDRAFKAIDFLALLDLHTLPAQARTRFFG